MNRPLCKRCKRPLDIWHDPESGIKLICNNPNTLQTDKEFKEYYNSLPGDEVAKLEKWYGPIYEPTATAKNAVLNLLLLGFIFAFSLLTFVVIMRKSVSFIIKLLIG